MSENIECVKSLKDITILEQEQPLTGKQCLRTKIIEVFPGWLSHFTAFVSTNMQKPKTRAPVSEHEYVRSR